MGVFGDGPANAANRVLPRLTLIAVETKFGLKWAITAVIRLVELALLKCFPGLY